MYRALRKTGLVNIAMLISLTTYGAGPENSDLDWPIYGNTMDAHRYSTASDITPSTVAQLRLAWSKKLGVPSSMEGTPIVKDGIMYVTTGGGSLFALDAQTGATKWSYAYPGRANPVKVCCGRDNRGVTLAGDMVVLPTLDAHLVALDAKTGAVRWNATIADWHQSIAITSPPVYADGLIITGQAGGEFTARGALTAVRPKDGHIVWRRYTVPAPGDPEAATWQMANGKIPRGGAPWPLRGSDPSLQGSR
jgi:glucose dehydrogenase